MSKQEPLLGTNLMPKEPALLVRVMLTLLPILIASGIGFNVYLTQQIASLDKRVTSTESWRDSHDKRVPELLAQVAKERDDADRSYQTATLRQGTAGWWWESPTGIGCAPTTRGAVTPHSRRRCLAWRNRLA